ncbi:MAG: adenylate kinase [Lachnospiraceae bacterium]|nr:adenylate kinase [Lachnospiraceae bacterium]
MNKIIVIGCPGAGKSTFTRRLHEKTQIPLFYLDMIWHRADKTTVSRERFDFELNEILKQERWIIDGNYMRTIPIRLQQCDTVFLLDYPLDVCIAGVESRIGKPRVDMPWTETEFDPEFRQWILDFSKEQLPKIYSWLQAYPDKEIHIFKSREEADDFLKYGLL